MDRVDAPKMLQHRLHRITYCIAFRYIGVEGHAVSACFRCSAPRLIKIAVQNCDGGPFARIGQRALSADAVGATRQHDHLSSQISHSTYVSPWALRCSVEVEIYISSAQTSSCDRKL